MAQERTSIINADWFHFSSFGVHAFLDESLGHGRDIFNGTIQPDSCIDAVGQQVTRNPGSRSSDIQAYAGVEEDFQDHLHKLEEVVG